MPLLRTRADCRVAGADEAMRADVLRHVNRLDVVRSGSTRALYLLYSPPKRRFLALRLEELAP